MVTAFGGAFLLEVFVNLVGKMLKGCYTEEKAAAQRLGDRHEGNDSTTGVLGLGEQKLESSPAEKGPK